MFNAAAETADDLFIGGKIGFTDITDMIGLALESVSNAPVSTLGDVLDADRAAREVVFAEASKL